MTIQQTTNFTADISTAVLVATYTATSGQTLLLHVYLAGLAGPENIRACYTKQRAGSGTRHQSGTAVMPVVAGSANALLETLVIPVIEDDIVRVYIQGSILDTAVVGAVEVHDIRELTDIEAAITAGLAGLNDLSLQEIRDAGKLAPTAGPNATGSIDALLDALIAAAAAIKAITDDINVAAVTYTAANRAGHLTITAGLTFDEAVAGLTIPADWVQAFWTLKANVRDADTASVVQIIVSNPPDLSDGVVCLNASALLPSGITQASGSLTVNQAGGSVALFLEDNLTAVLAAESILGWDVKFIDAAGDSVGWRGTADIVPTETQTV